MSLIGAKQPFIREQYESGSARGGPLSCQATAGFKIADQYAFEVVIRNGFRADFGALRADNPRRRPACEPVADRASAVAEPRSASWCLPASQVTFRSKPISDNRASICRPRVLPRAPSPVRRAGDGSVIRLLPV